LPETCLRQAGAGRQGRRRTAILQVPASTAYSVKPALPEGKLFFKNRSLYGRIKPMRVMQVQHFYNPLILKA